jgi:microcystin-dependent protein
MALNFPNSPSDGQVYQDYVYDATKGVWRSAVMVGAAPCGSIMAYAGNLIPAGWLDSDGSTVSRVTYSSLFAALGGIASPWGQGNGTTTFELPDLRGRVLTGLNSSGTFNAMGALGGAETMSLSEAHLASHTHSFSGTTNTTGNHNHAPPVAITNGGNAGNYRSLFATNSPFWSMADNNNATNYGGNHSHTVSGTTGGTGSGSAFGILAPYVVVRNIIKYTAVVASSDTEIAVRMGEAEATVTAQAVTITDQANIIAGYESRVSNLEVLPVIISGQVGSYTTVGVGKVPFNDFWVTRGISYNSSTRRFIVPTAGVYRVTFNPFQNNSVTTRVFIGLNNDAPNAGNHRGHAYSSSSSYTTMNLNSVFEMAAGDYVVFYILEGAIYNTSGDRFNQFAIERIGA